jgi:hypothetical protein
MLYCTATTKDSFWPRAVCARVSAALPQQVRTRGLARCPLIMLLISRREAWCVRGDMTMVSGSRRSSFGRSGIGTLVAACLACATVANAQIQQDVDRCTGKDSVTPDLQISGCTAVIGSKASPEKNWRSHSTTAASRITPSGFSTVLSQTSLKR